VGGLGVFLYTRKGSAVSKTPIKIKDFSIPNYKSEADIAIVQGEDHYKATQKAMEIFGGMSNFIKKDDVVFIKPNAAWNRPPELAATTNPEVFRAVIEMVMKEGAKKVIVADNTCNNAKKSFESSGIEKVCQQTGAELVFLNDDTDYVPLVGSGTFLDTWQFLKLFQEVDNVPVVKSHSSSETTISMKNWFGVVAGKRSLLHQNIHQSVAFLAKVVKPTLIIADATRVMMKNGPSGGSLDDVKVFDEVIVGTDQVLVDTYGSNLMGFEGNLPEYINIAERIGVGTKNLQDAKKRTLAI
jgi:uncharacterized protein (DUF362 family)